MCYNARPRNVPKKAENQVDATFIGYIILS